MRKSLLRVLARLKWYWLIRRLYWTSEQRRQHGFAKNLASHPELRALQARIEAAQEHYRRASTDPERADRSEAANDLIDLYNARRAELAQELRR